MREVDRLLKATPTWWMPISRVLGYRFEAGRRLVRKKSLMALKDKVRSHIILDGESVWVGYHERNV